MTAFAVEGRGVVMDQLLPPPLTFGVNHAQVDPGSDAA